MNQHNFFHTNNHGLYFYTEPSFKTQNMKYEFRLNGSIKLIIKPESNLEIELFKELFAGEVKVEPTTSTNPSGEIVVEKIVSTQK